MIKAEDNGKNHELALVTEFDKQGEKYYKLSEFRLVFTYSTPTILNGDGLCVVCGKDSDKKCGACGIQYYCSVEHQKSDWRSHKLSCPGFKGFSPP